MKLERMQPGMTLHSYGKARDLMRTRCSWPVRVLEVDLVTRRVKAAWNYNQPIWFSERHAAKWRQKPYVKEVKP